MPRFSVPHPGGFLAGATQTTTSVAGALLGNKIAGMFGSNEAQAAETTSEPQTGDADPGFDDSSDFGEF